MENEIVIHNENDLRSKIYTIRGMRVMLDFDLAETYGYSVKAFNQQVKNNIEKFDEDFRFQLTWEECNTILKSKILTSSWGGIRKLPYAFTEQGIYMLMTVLRGDLAIKQSKILIRLFKTMKDFIIERENLIGSDEVARLAIQTSQNTKDIARIDQKLSEISRKIHGFSPIEIPSNLLYLDGKTVETNEDQPKFDIENKILVIRGQQVMLDFDLAEIYGYTVKALNQQVKRNINRFPADFMFQLTRDEVDLVKSQIVTSPNQKYFAGQEGGVRKLPYAFTEQGIYMLATVLHGELAEQQTIFIMRAFREMRLFIRNNSRVFAEIDSIKQHLIESDIHHKENDRKILELFDKMDKYKIEEKQGIFFQGQIFDAYAKFESFIAEAEKEIVLIDNYVDLTVLERFAKKKNGVKVTIFTCLKTKITSLDIQKFNEQYPTLELNHTEKIHDRFLIIDNKILYHIGASLKDLGKKCFGFEIMDSSWIAEILRNL